MDDKLKLIRKGLRAAKDTCVILKRARTLLRQGLISLIRDAVGDNCPITFNDTTGIPIFRHNLSGCMLYYAVRVTVENGERVLQFNNMTGDDDYGLDPSGWFNPDSCGTFDGEELLDCIKAAIFN